MSSVLTSRMRSFVADPLRGSALATCDHPTTRMFAKFGSRALQCTRSTTTTAAAEMWTWRRADIRRTDATPSGAERRLIRSVARIRPACIECTMPARRRRREPLPATGQRPRPPPDATRPSRTRHPHARSAPARWIRRVPATHAGRLPPVGLGACPASAWHASVRTTENWAHAVVARVWLPMQVRRARTAGSPRRE
jgi:hypothetical protein